ncbi:chitin synthase chs-2-like [Saccostrea cucullata]|uniref:chitin synthase chs-2-like n=1 Tax=Saccostrea cuccullata TaxID=36930 RepID=UPI002ED14AEE
MTFLASCWRVFFGNIKRPSFTTVLMCAGIEVLHSIGLCVLVFKLLPDLGALQRICLLSATALLPSVLKLFSIRELQSFKPGRKLGTIMMIIVDIVAIVMQMSAILFLLHPYFKFKPETYQPINANETQVLDSGIFSELSTDLSWYFKVLLSLLLCSVSWWENFVLDKACFSEAARQNIRKVRYELQESRPYIYIFVSFLKIAITILFARLLVGESIGLLKGEFWSEVRDYKKVAYFSDIIALIISSFVGYSAAYTSCKLQMQQISFSLPCLLSTPLFIVLLTYYCETSEDYISMFSTNNIDCDDEMLGDYFYIMIFGHWFLSIYWIGQHIWYPSQERLAKVKT